MTVAPEADLTIDTDELDGKIVVRIDGELDIAGAPRLREVLMQALDSDGSALVEVDLSELRFIDSTGLGVLVGAHRRLASTGRKLRVFRPRSSTYRVLELCGLTGSFEIIEPPEPVSP